jgi:hypothetical protein
VPPAYALLLTLAVTAPLLRPGYLLLRDAVSTPRSYLSDAALGLGDAAPRAVPQDFLVATLSAAVDGGIVVKIMLIGGIFLAGWGAARLALLVVPDAGLGGQLVAATIAVWNPYVAERLLQGHWSLLVGYGSLPWVAAAMLRLRRTTPDRSHWAVLVFWVALAGVTPTGAILAAAVAVVMIATPGSGAGRLRCLGVVTTASAVTALPWLTAAALGSTLGTPQSGAAAFAARAEPGLGTLGSLAGLGGIWNSEAVPTSRTTLLALLATSVLLGVVIAGLPSLLSASRRPMALPLLLLAVVGVALPAAMATDAGLEVLRSAMNIAPGLGVLRDGQKWVALAMPGYAVAGAAAALSGRRVSTPLTAVVCAAALVAVLPDLVWGVAGKVRAVQYPAGWAAVAQVLNANPGTVAVLPPDTLRLFRWAGPAPVLDPLPRWVRADVLATGDLTISGETVVGEGARARAIQRALLAGAPPAELAAAGVDWIVLEGDSVQPGPAGRIGRAGATLAQLPVAYRDADIAVYRVRDSNRVATTGKRAVLIVAHLIWLVTLLAGAVISLGAARSKPPVPISRL